MVISVAREAIAALVERRRRDKRLRRELDRLRGVLRDHGIDPDGGTAQPA
jgi:transposase